MGSFKLKLALYFALLALLPSAIAFYGFDTLAQRSETRGVDARLQAGLRSSLAAYGAVLDDAQRTARAVARDPDLQRALRRGDRAAIAEIARSNPSLTITAGPLRIGTAPTLAARRTVDIVQDGRILGHVSIAVPIDGALLRDIRTGLDDGDRLLAVRDGRVVAGAFRGASVSVPSGAPKRVRIQGTRYRALATAPLDNPPGVELVAVTPQSAVDSAVSGTERRLFVALLGSLALFALVTYLLGRSIVRTLAGLADAANALAHGDLGRRVEVRGRDEFAQLADAFNRMAGELEQRLIELDEERHRLRESTTRFGEALEATHDVEQLLRVIVETAVEATGAYGGIVLDEGRELVRAGDPDAGLQKIAFPLRAGQSDFGSLVLAAPQFDSDQVETAATLAANAVIALENARLHRIVEQQALVDPLTELANRRALAETLHAEVARAERFGDAVSFVLADLDDFKAVNDRYGHPVGDTVLRAFARTLADTVREIDVAGRWGGEEFALILPGTDAAGGAALAERARQAIEAQELHAPNGDVIPVTSSFGVASFPASDSVDALVAAADAALYRAKREGKNRVVNATEATTR
jgi:diguanylate cyclase (GGDEF)-like protein